MSSRRVPALVLAFVAAVATFVWLAPAPASAHNSLVTSDPADGTTLTAPPSSITWTFKNSVPLETMSVFLTDAAGARSELSGSRHAPGNTKQVITPLPPTIAGSISIRWRLVSPDGHVVSGRVALTLPATSTTPTTPAAPTTGPPPSDAPTATATDTAAPPTTAASREPGTPDAGDAEDTSVPGALRWILRYASYLAIMSVVGLLIVKAFVWGAVDTQPLARRAIGVSLLATAVLSALQLLVLASDVAGDPPWASLDALGTATSTDAGASFVVRILLALALWFVLIRCSFTVAEVYWTAVSICAVGLLATWSFAGHSWSMRWAEVGVATDVLHHGAAAAWLTGLGVTVWLVRSSSNDPHARSAVGRFSRLAAASVAIIAATGAIQSVRLVGNPANLFDGAHGRALAIKVVLVGAMLGLASANRKRLRSALSSSQTTDMTPLRRAVVAEVVLGLAVIAATATMVASAPATSSPEVDSQGQANQLIQERP